MFLEMETLIRELKYGARSLLRDRGFTVTVVLTLAVCIAANTATFAIVNSVLLRPLPVPDADRIMLMANRYPKAGVGDLNNSASGDYFDRLRNLTVLQDQAMFRQADQTLEIAGRATQVPGLAVTPSFFHLIQVPAAFGRTFTVEEGEIGNERKVILSSALWRQLYGGDASAIGGELRINGQPHAIVGIMPPGFAFVNPEVRFWVPLAFSAADRTRYHSNNWYHIGRLKSGATAAQLQAQLDALNAANMKRLPEFKELLVNAGFHTKVEPLQHMLVKDVERALYLLWGGAMLVLLIGALNLANLALARLSVRRKEIATRLALGAGRVRLWRQLSVESVLIAIAGGALGVLLGNLMLRTLAAVGLDRFPRSSEVEINLVVTCAAFATAITVGFFIAFLSLPNLLDDRLSSLLHGEGRSGTSELRTRRFRRALVGAEIGFAFVLLTGAGLLLVSFRALLHVDPGFTANGVVTASTNAPRARYPNPHDLSTLVNRALDSIGRLPGVSGAGVTTHIPLGGDYSDSVLFAEGYVLRPGESVVSPHQLSVTPGYFEAMNIKLVSGRYFEDRDNDSAQHVVIVDEKLANRFWPNRSPIGRRVYQPQSASNPTRTDASTRWNTVVGVVRSVRLADLAGSSPVGAYYFPYAQKTSRGFTFAVRTRPGMDAIGNAIRAEITRIDPQLTLFDLRTMADRAELSLSARRTSMLLATTFAVLAVFLSAIGVYGVLAYLVTQRRREIGIRMALGSTGGGVVRLVIREGIALVLIGLVVGVAGTASLRQAIASQVYGVQPFDPIVIGSVMVILAAIALGACVIPARRALQVDPVTVLNE